MLSEFSRAQAGVEYLITYGWALVLIVTFASVLFFVFSPPAGEKIDFSLSDNNRFLLKSGNVAAGGGTNKAELLLQNATNHSIPIVGTSSTVYESDNDITVNGAVPSVALPIIILAGQQIKILNIDVPTSGEVSGDIILSYKDKEEYKVAIIKLSGKIRPKPAKR